MNGYRKRRQRYPRRNPRAYEIGVQLFGTEGIMTSNKAKSDAFDNAAGETVERGTFWQPSVGDVLVGKYTQKKDEGGKFDRPVATILTPDGKLVPVGLNAMLEDLLPGDLVGEFVAIQMTDEEDTGKGHPFRHFRVKKLADRDAAQKLWDEVGADLPF